MTPDVKPEEGVSTKDVPKITQTECLPTTSNSSPDSTPRFGRSISEIIDEDSDDEEYEDLQNLQEIIKARNFEHPHNTSLDTITGQELPNTVKNKNGELSWNHHDTGPLKVSDYIKSITNSHGSAGSNKQQTDNNKQKRDISHRYMKFLGLLFSYHRKLGMRHLLIIALCLFYSFGGGAIFYFIEAPNEIKVMHEREALLEEAFRTIASDLSIQAVTSDDSLAPSIQNAYASLLKIEDRYFGSTLYKKEGPENLQWSFNSAMFFSSNLFTTAGYGVIYCATTLGKAMTLVYAMITVPLTFVVLRDLGQFSLFHLTKCYAKVLLKIREARGFPTEDSEEIRLPIKFAWLAVLAYLLLTATFVYNYDAHWGKESIGYFDAVYFSYLTMAVIGLGDVMPVHATYSSVIATVFFFGMPFTRVLNRIAYLSLENGIHGLFTLLEQKLDGFFEKHRTAYEVPQSLDTPAQSRKISTVSTVEEEEAMISQSNQMTLTSIAAMMRERRDVFGGDFGRVTIHKKDI